MTVFMNTSEYQCLSRRIINVSVILLTSKELKNGAHFLANPTHKGIVINMKRTYNNVRVLLMMSVGERCINLCFFLVTYCNKHSK